MRLEQLGHPRTGSPQRRRPRASRRRHVLADRLEQLPNEAVGGPIGEADLAAALADPDQFGAGTVLVGREHHAEAGDDDIEAAIGERQSFGIRLTELYAEPVGQRALTGPIEQGRT